jgi:hypothetical protein
MMNLVDISQAQEDLHQAFSEMARLKSDFDIFQFTQSKM